MQYKKFKEIFNQSIFEKSKLDLIRKIATYPERYVGLFRPTKPKAKIIQNLLQSHEIRFGDAFETLIEEYLKESGFNILDKRFQSNGDSLEVDQMFADENTIYFVEQKVRDDHDSSKKRGQIDNFEKKVSVILEANKGKKVEGFFYFIDDSFTKNKNFYEAELQKLSTAYGITLHLCYGNDLFTALDQAELWDEILSHLRSWKSNIPDLPEINFDIDPQVCFEEIKDLKTMEYRKLFSNHNLDDLLCVLFPEQKTLNLLNEYFQSKHHGGGGQIYATLKKLCTQAMNRIKKHHS